ncbi:MAG TPA: DUF6157 family protein [Dehalococcoidia bacterium]
MDLNYYQTLIAVADDCPVTRSVVPEDRNGQRTVAAVQYELLADSPYVYTQEDVLFLTWLRRQEAVGRSEAEVAELRRQFFSKPQACLRSSPLPKRYGWGLHFNEQGRVALSPIESARYAELRAGGTVKVLKALRSKRA